jgi:hypothetical protein
MDNAIVKLTLILQRVCFECSASAQVNIIVGLVIDTIGADACSLCRAKCTSVTASDEADTLFAADLGAAV